MILASAQTKPSRFNIEENLLDHYQMVKVAASYGAGLIAFPEMSLTGYERDKAHELAFTPSDARLERLRILSEKHRIVIIAGAPVSFPEGMMIGAFVISPDGSLSVYTKQFLHPGEEVSFTSSFDHNPILDLQGERISLAICADIDHPEHAANACTAKSTCYVPSIFFSPGGIAEAYASLSHYAKTYGMNVLMSNFCCQSWGRPAGGKSAFWNKNGELKGALDDSTPGLLVADTSSPQKDVLCIYM